MYRVKKIIYTISFFYVIAETVGRTVEGTIQKGKKNLSLETALLLIVQYNCIYTLICIYVFLYITIHCSLIGNKIFSGFRFAGRE